MSVSLLLVSCTLKEYNKHMRLAMILPEENLM